MMIHTHKKQQQQTFYFQSSCGRLEIIKPNTWHPILKKIYRGTKINNWIVFAVADTKFSLVLRVAS